ncbi:MAG TPA: DUF116 domain-containing protein [Methanocellaceae archaeon]
MGLTETIFSALTFIALVTGSVLLVALALSLVIIIIVLLLLAYSFKTGNFLLPNLMVFSIVFFEGPIKAVLRLFGVDDTRVDKLSINITNRAMWAAFRKTPFNRRAIFVPQCLRSVDCPARLSPEGIICKDCGRCEISAAKKESQNLGYMFFIVPGSSFIVRMIRKYRPEAIVGVGCLCEVKEGLDLMHKYKIVSIGAVLDRSGCVATEMNWKKLYEIMRAEHIHGSRRIGVDNVPVEVEKHIPPTF